MVDYDIRVRHKIKGFESLLDLVVHALQLPLTALKIGGRPVTHIELFVPNVVRRSENSLDRQIRSDFLCGALVVNGENARRFVEVIFDVLLLKPRDDFIALRLIGNRRSEKRNCG